MKTSVWFAYAMIWLSVSIAVSVGIYFTRNIHCLWFLLVPSFISIKTGSLPNRNGYPSIEVPEPHGELVDIREVRDKMIKYGFTAPDMTVTEFVEDELTAVLEASEVKQ